MIVKICNLFIAGRESRELPRGRSGAFPRRHTHTLHNVPGTKLVKRFIKRARGENHTYRQTLLEMKQYVDVR